MKPWLRVLSLSTLAGLLVAFSSFLMISGLNAPEPIDPYLNGVFPASLSTDVKLDDSIESVNSALAMTSEPGGTRLFVAQRNGAIFSFVPSESGLTQKTTFLDISQRVWTGQDSGLLGIAFHPEYNQGGSPNNSYFYVYYVTNINNTQYIRLSRFSGTAQGDPNSEFVLIEQRLGPTLHRGGGLIFGKDGFLYLSIGDLGWPQESQNITNRFVGGVLRIDVDQQGGSISHPPRRRLEDVGEGTSGNGYYIPNDNPFLDSSGGLFEEYYSLGARNPHNMTMDRVTGEIYIGNVGSNSGDKKEEVNLLVKGGNYGWPFREGNVDRPDIMPRPNPIIGSLEDPIHEYKHTSGDGCSVIGGYVYRGSDMPALYGKYIFTDYCGKRIWSMDLNVLPATTKEELVTTGFSPITFGEDSEGELYVGGLGNNKVKKISPSVPNSGGTLPLLLSQTGAFSDLTSLTPAQGVIPYTVNAPLWSDGAGKGRWVAVPNDGTHNTSVEDVIYSENEEWNFPIGTVFIKHFEIALDERSPEVTKRLETRFLVQQSDGGYYGFTYRWNSAGTDADLLETSLNETLTIIDQSGTSRQQNWSYPGRADCFTCHTEASGFVLGPKARQLNGDLFYTKTGLLANQLESWNHIGLFNQQINVAGLPQILTSKNLYDTSASLEDRALSYLDANCASCHRPQGGPRSTFDLRLNIPLAQSGLINAPVIEDLGIPGARVIVPGDPDRSILYQRLSQVGTAVAMPPLAKNKLDADAVSMIRQWIQGMDVPPPSDDYIALYRINTGGAALVAADGSALGWSEDTAANPSPYRSAGGESLYATGAAQQTSGIVGPAVALDMFKTERWDQNSGSEMSWDLPVTPGKNYKVRLYFSETAFNGPGVRIFDVAVEGQIPLEMDDLDVFSVAGGNNTGIMFEVNLNAADDNLDIDFTRVVQNPMIKGIEILEGVENQPPVEEYIALYRVNTGGPELAASDGSALSWSADLPTSPSLYLAGGSATNFSTGAAQQTTGTIGEAAPTDLFKTERWDSGGGSEMAWAFPVTPERNYKVRLYFSEIWSGVSAPGQRVFDVAVEGTILPELDDLDVFALTGSRDIGIMMELDTYVTDDNLNIDLFHVVQNPMIKGIEILEGAPTPPSDAYVAIYRINTGGIALAPSDGSVLAWSEDTGANPSPYRTGGGGNQYTTGAEQQFNGEADPAVVLDMFKTERWDPSADAEMSWDFPVASGANYKVRLYFAETAFTSANARIFDVAVEGTIPPELDDLDVFSTAGGANIGVMFEVDVTAADNNLDIDFTRVVQNPMIKGLEILQQGIDSLDTGSITYDWWANISGNPISNLTNAPNYPDNPDGSSVLGNFKAPTNWANAYGARARGYVHAPVTGDYTFWIASDDNGELWLSSDENPSNKELIAWVKGWTPSNVWEKYPEQQSATITLEAGKRYYIEALQKEGGGGDNLAVAWQIPGEERAIIAGTYLSPLDLSAPTVPALAQHVSNDARIGLPGDYALTSIYPNPFAQQATIAYQLPEHSEVSIEIYAITGQRVRVLKRNEEMPAGNMQSVWDGTDDGGRRVANGVYLVRLRANDFMEVAKVVLVK